MNNLKTEKHSYERIIVLFGFGSGTSTKGPAVKRFALIFVLLEDSGNLKEVEPCGRSYIVRGISLREIMGHWSLPLSLCVSQSKMHKVSSSLCRELPTGAGVQLVQ